MKMIEKIRRRNLALNMATVMAASSIAVYSYAAPDYDRIRKDINVMTGIVTSAFKDNRDCNRCSVRIDGHYLAEQGVVFNVKPSSGSFGFAFGDDVEIVTRDIVVGIPDMVSDILDDVQVNIDDSGHSWVWQSDDGSSAVRREAREELREARRALREATRELREVAIERIHARDDDLKALEAREAELETRIAEMESRQNEIEQSISEEAAVRVKERQARREETMEKRRAQNQQIENIVLNTFCDYSRTMRSIPGDEKISIIVNQNDEAANIYVFDQKDLASCDSTRGNVRDHALSYTF